GAQFDLDRLEWIVWCRIQWMWTGVEDDQRIHLNPQGELLARLRDGVKMSIARIITDHFAEPIDVGRHVGRAQAVFCQLYQKRVVTILQPLVTVRLVITFSPSLFDERRIAVAADGVVPVEIIFNDRRKNSAHV